MKRVLIIESGLFVGGVINDVLKSHPSRLDVKSYIPADVEDIRKIFREYQPDVVIADDTSPDDLMNAILMQSICFPNMRLVIFCASTNNVNIYSTQRVEVAHLNDFLTVLTEGDPGATAPT
jgi:hypothetical protein